MLTALLVPLLTLGSPAEELNFKIIDVSVFKTGLVYITREAAVPSGTHTYRVTMIPKAIDNTFWYGSPDGAEISDVLTRLQSDETSGKKPILDIGSLLSENVGSHVRLVLRGLSPKGDGVVEGKLLSYRGDAGNVNLLDKEGLLRVIGFGEIRGVDTHGLKTAAKETKTTPRLELFLRTSADKASHVRFTSLEAGAAWNAGYEINLGDGTADVAAKAQLAMGDFRLDGALTRMVTGIPKMGGQGRFDLTTGYNSLRAWLQNQSQAEPWLMQKSDDPYEKLAVLLTTNPYWQQNYNRFGIGGGGGFGGNAGGFGGGRADESVERSPVDSLSFVRQNIAASRTEDLFTYPMGFTTLGAGERLTRVLSRTKATVENKYLWVVNINRGDTTDAGIKRVMLLNNASSSPWPTGVAFIVRDHVPIAQIPMPFTPSGKTATLELGDTEDLPKSLNPREISRKDVVLFDSLQGIEIETEIRFVVENTRLEPIPLELRTSVWGDVLDAKGATIEKVGEFSDRLNPRSLVVWNETLALGQRKEFLLHYKTRIYR